ncbi:MAG: Protoporphyrinogen IX oxidase, novel form, HemJ (EC [uncultured Sulfurovum sp.]|uniref:Protoporphyrinogen IX oxidase n=1 Tax=uncultured Sulfurovum sp. TaxID=269237 RepID=A0A6S6S2P2_9BACT|nr:MAG: Protoporphyrinogen IX oxidase, novel form, HemJ (EC [uncultured Sulfurovum sp.]
MEYYTWILAFHVMSFVSWMAMLFYLPRLFIYHRENADTKAFTDIVEVQEYKLFKYIGVPAMWATIITGAVMLYLNTAIFSSGGWMYAKLFVLAFLIAYHVSLGNIRKILIDNPHYKSSKWLRFYNEVPTLLMIFIVIMVVVKPF